jgi:hypothetical protein
MGLGTRIFIVKEDDSIERLTLKRYKQLLKGHPDKQLTQFAGKRIRYALMALEMVNRKPVKILMAEYSFLTFDSEGQLDTTEGEKVARLAIDTLEPIAVEKESAQIIDAKHKFAKKRFDDRYLWTPTPEIEAAIKAAIFGR